MKLNRNKFGFIFPSTVDKKRVLERGPWAINGDHLVLINTPPNISLHEIDFSTTTFWVRILGLPRELISDKNARKIATKLVKAVDVDKNSLGIFSEAGFMQIRVDIFT
ncbi:hypothetical protein PanWU01x14_314760 [Parasponia andersonii]|uniref:Uncharacterized protein n=1 Tax=Parasponia andersonii TaxID=3476 RepID=A0A2P5ANP2_PARAD|nr:hypothetical protein PanWU01x14_314760 [Parasponia andersonii]